MDRRTPYILFADDEVATLDALRRYCFSFGWIGDFVQTAGDLVDSVNRNSATGAHPYDALVCDINYVKQGDGPTVSNVAAVRSIRQSFPELPVVFISSYSTYWIKDEIRKLNGEFFAKPIDFEHLFERIAFLVKWHRSIETPADLAVDRRRNAINTTDQCRRKTDACIEIPRVLTATVAEMRELRPGH